MKTTIHYSTNCTVAVIMTNGELWNWGLPVITLAEAMDLAEAILTDKCGLLSECVEVVYITDSGTGELLAECRPEDIKNNNRPIDNVNYSDVFNYVKEFLKN